MRQRGEVTGGDRRGKGEEGDGQEKVPWSSPVCLPELCQKPLKGNSTAWAQGQGFDAAKRFWPKEIRLKPKREVYEERVETDR